MFKPETSIQFYVKLLKVRQAGDDISRNCTHVKDDYWIFEGDEESLDSKFEIVGEGVVGPLGGLSQQELIEICDQDLGVAIP